jgi:hypothetical protein
MIYTVILSDVLNRLKYPSGSREIKKVNALYIPQMMIDEVIRENEGKSGLPLRYNNVPVIALEDV